MGVESGGGGEAGNASPVNKSVEDVHGKLDVSVSFLHVLKF